MFSVGDTVRVVANPSWIPKEYAGTKWTVVRQTDIHDDVTWYLFSSSLGQIQGPETDFIKTPGISLDLSGITDWLPMSPAEGPPLPKKFGIYWPWYKA